ncbi:MAG: chemotaxis protein CheA, partial [Proteobacteria bacterium]
MNEFLTFFLDEAVDILIGWEKTALRLEEDSSAEVKDELYRAAHNLKSGSGAVGLDAFHHLVHAVEDLISLVMKADGAVAPATIRVFLDTHSTLSQWIDRLRTGDETVPVGEIAAIQEALAPYFADTGHASSEGVLDTTDAVVTVSDSPVEETAVADSSDSQPLLYAAQDDDVKPSAAAPIAPAHSTPAAAPTVGQTTPAKSQETIRVAASKLDNLIELVGELATQQSIVWHAKQTASLDSEASENAIHLIQKIAKDLQNLSLSLRLQPLQSVFQRLERTIRDLARSQDKKVQVVLRGEDVELDKSVAERIADALTHIVRNAIDHGIETFDERAQSGKGPTANIQLEALPAANGVLIKIIDDGRGLNADRIRKKAIERGLITTQQNLSENDIHRLIFQAGLSTAEKVTDVSGRGVGMDVVKTAVENIGGNIQLSSSFGHGTTFSISLPATLSIVDVLLVEAGSILYALPLQDVAEIIDLGDVDLQSLPGGKQLIRLRDSVIPLEDLATHLPQNKRAEGQMVNAGDAMQPAIIIRVGDNLIAFHVKKILGQQLVTVRGLPSVIAHIPGYTGGTILGDGNPCVVLNLSALASRHFEHIHRSEAAAGGAHLDQMSRFEENDSRCLIIESGRHIFATSLMMVREILEDIPCENLPDVHGRPHPFISVRGDLIPVLTLGEENGHLGLGRDAR